jgi:hypothetical protein
VESGLRTRCEYCEALKVLHVGAGVFGGARRAGDRGSDLASIGLRSWVPVIQQFFFLPCFSVVFLNCSCSNL